MWVPALFDICLVSESGGEVRAQGVLRVQADFSIRDCPPLDVLIIAGGCHCAGIDMSLHLVSRLHGRELEETTARQMEFTWSG